ncbi:ISL3 family transposase [Bordetella bronchiseptica]|uniref:ISL3 family transposase n=1 Tax=Bordetella bronchiseptica TaxID=518 RepID=UPI000460AD92|nr:ISL3 family transposase [Bordetella bronchiseptica]KDC48067.1 transposase [Bordetella bronchiseptica M85/00/2]
MDLLDLPGWKTTGRDKTDGLDIREAVFECAPDVCPSCGVVGELYKHGTRTIEYLDAPAYGIQTRLRALLRRYRCRACSATFMQPATGVMEKPRMTERAYLYIQSQGLQEPFTAVAKRVGCDEKTVRNATAELIEQINAEYVPKVPEYLGLDETKLCGEFCAMITDVDGRQPVDILSSRSPDVIAMWLRQNEAHKHVKCVTTDMYRPYFNLVQSLLPGVPLVVDKFHIVRMVDFAVETVRRRVAKSRPTEVGRAWKRQSVLLRLRRHKLNDKGRFNLDMWLDNEPELAGAYWLKERFYDIFDAPDRKIATTLLDAWRESVPANLSTTPRKDFRAVMTATANWRNEILNYFDHRISNAYTESLNGHLKRINRAGFGYTFPVLRARLLWPVISVPTEDLMEQIVEEAKAPTSSISLSSLFSPSGQVEEMYRLRREIYEHNGGHCQVCGGKYDMRELWVPPEEPLLQCRMCFERTHPH